MPDLCLSRPRMSGPAVRKLQKRLAALGFDPGRIDGVFRVQTDRAVRAFQKAQGLTVDGVAGPDTMGALTGGRSLAQHRDATGALSADVIAAVIGCPVENVRTNWPPLLEALGAQGIDTVPCQSAALATVGDRKSTRLNSRHVKSSDAVFCVKKKKRNKKSDRQCRSEELFVGGRAEVGSC